MTLWELAACVQAYNKANGADQTPTLTVEEYEEMMAMNADFISPTVH